MEFLSLSHVQCQLLYSIRFIRGKNRIIQVPLLKKDDVKRNSFPTLTYHARPLKTRKYLFATHPDFKIRTFFCFFRILEYGRLLWEAFGLGKKKH